MKIKKVIIIFFILSSTLTRAEVLWTYDSLTKTLTFSGEERILYSLDVNLSPWDSLRLSTRKIVIQDGVEIIGNHAFSEFENLYEISLPATLKEIGFGAFEKCKSLRFIDIPISVTDISGRVFAVNSFFAVL